MKKKPTDQQYATNPDNVELLQLMSGLDGHGLTQREIAALLAISPWPASRGGSTTTREKSMPAGQLPSRASTPQTACTRASTLAKRCCETGLSAIFLGTSAAA